MMLHPHHVGRCGTAHHAVRILDCGVLGLFRRHIGSVETFAEHRPVLAAVAALPDTAARNRKEDVIAVARIRRDAVDPGGIVAAAEPALANPTSCQVSPRSSERNKPAGMAPIHSRSGCCAPPASMVQTWNSEGALATSAGNAGATSSRQFSPPSSERCSLAPKWPCLSAA